MESGKGGRGGTSGNGHNEIKTEVQVKSLCLALIHVKERTEVFKHMKDSTEFSQNVKDITEISPQVAQPESWTFFFTLRMKQRPKK